MKEIGKRIYKDVKNLWIVAAAIAAYTVFMNLLFHAFCPTVILTGFPCPGCGMTRAIFYLITGRASQSIRMHPMGIPVVCLFLYFAWNRYVLGRKAKGMKVLIGAGLALLVICFVWRMVLYFPDRVPYVYTSENILAGIFPFYEQILHEWKIL